MHNQRPDWNDYNFVLLNAKVRLSHITVADNPAAIGNLRQSKNIVENFGAIKIVPAAGPIPGWLIGDAAAALNPAFNFGSAALQANIRLGAAEPGRLAKST